MTREEWIGISQRMVLRWPHARVPDATFKVWFDDLCDKPGEHVAAAIDAFYAEGREWPPTGGQVLARLAEDSRISFDECYRQINDALVSHVPGERFEYPEDELAAEMLREIGVGTARALRDEPEGFMRRDLMRIYRDLVRRQGTELAQLTYQARPELPA